MGAPGHVAVDSRPGLGSQHARSKQKVGYALSDQTWPVGVLPTLYLIESFIKCTLWDNLSKQVFSAS